MVRTTVEERQRICEILAGIHNAVFDDDIGPDDIELSQLRSPEHEMDAYGHYFGVNIALWRRWGPVKKLEVILHEMTHVADPDDGHRPSFWDRFVDIVETAEAYQEQVEAVLDAEVDFEAVKRKIVDEVHEEIVDQRMDTVADRKRWCREQFGLSRQRRKQVH